LTSSMATTTMARNTAAAGDTRLKSQREVWYLFFFATSTRVTTHETGAAHQQKNRPQDLRMASAKVFAYDPELTASMVTETLGGGFGSGQEEAAGRGSDGGAASASGSGRTKAVLGPLRVRGRTGAPVAAVLANLQESPPHSSTRHNDGDTDRLLGAATGSPSGDAGSVPPAPSSVPGPGLASVGTAASRSPARHAPSHHRLGSISEDNATLNMAMPQLPLTARASVCAMPDAAAAQSMSPPPNPRRRLGRGLSQSRALASTGDDVGTAPSPSRTKEARPALPALRNREKFPMEHKSRFVFDPMVSLGPGGCGDS
jgi:hypothetical protein